MEIVYNEIQQCKECGDRLRGRADKRYCHDACRSAFNNRKNKALLDPIKSINMALSRNRKILKEVYDLVGDENSVNVRKLIIKGFLFDYYTHIQDASDGKQYKYCYDFGYVESSNGEYLISKYPVTYL